VRPLQDAMQTRTVQVCRKCASDIFKELKCVFGANVVPSFLLLCYCCQLCI